MPRAGLSTAKVVTEAAALVDASGGGGLTLAALAKRFGVALPSLYKHVDGLDDLHTRLAVLTMQELGRELRRSLTGRSGRDAVLALAGGYRDYARRHPGRYAYLLAAQRDDGGNSLAEAERVAAAREILEVFDGVFDGYGVTAETSRIDAARYLRSVLHGFVSLENAGGFAMDRDVSLSFERLVDATDRSLASWEDPRDG